MKILNRDQFLKMPPGTVYSKYEPVFFYDIEIKGDSIYFNGGGNDFGCQHIKDAVDAGSSEDFADILLAAEETGGSFKMDFDCQGRDGLFEDDQLFAVWEKEDVEALIKRLEETLA